MKKETDLSALQRAAYNNDNLHLIAISNLNDPERRIIRWWSKKYKSPQKPLEEHTIEELIIEMLEDYYDNNVTEASRFLEGIESRTYRYEDVWDGTMPDDYQRNVVAGLKGFYNKNRVDLAKYQSDEELTPEQEEEIVNNLGKNLPRSKSYSSSKVGPRRGIEVPTIGGDEFDESFEV